MIKLKRLLLTGFEPFLGCLNNPTMGIMEKLDGAVINDYEIHGRILTVDFSKSGKNLLDEINKMQPDAVISLGLAGGRNKITLERIAINCNEGDTDNTGNKPENELIFEDGQYGNFSTLPIDQMVKRLIESGLPTEISHTSIT